MTDGWWASQLREPRLLFPTHKGGCPTLWVQSAGFSIDKDHTLPHWHILEAPQSDAFCTPAGQAGKRSLLMPDVQRLDYTVAALAADGGWSPMQIDHPLLMGRLCSLTCNPEA
eukprot:jgi/Ulvmu1/1245/UM109_0043.1